MNIDCVVLKKFNIYFQCLCKYSQILKAKNKISALHVLNKKLNFLKTEKLKGENNELEK